MQVGLLQEAELMPGVDVAQPLLGNDRGGRARRPARLFLLGHLGTALQPPALRGGGAGSSLWRGGPAHRPHQAADHVRGPPRVEPPDSRRRTHGDPRYRVPGPGRTGNRAFQQRLHPGRLRRRSGRDPGAVGRFDRGHRQGIHARRARARRAGVEDTSTGDRPQAGTETPSAPLGRGLERAVARDGGRTRDRRPVLRELLRFRVPAGLHRRLPEGPREGHADGAPAHRAHGPLRRDRVLRGNEGRSPPGRP